MKKEFVTIGEKVDLHTGRGPTYRTMIEDITDDGLLWISVPYYRGIPIALRRDQGLQLYFYRQNGRFCLDVKVVDFRMSGEVRLIALQILYGPRKQQRRESYRYRKSLDAVVRTMVVGPFPEKPDMDDMLDEQRLRTENISETGALLISKTEYEVGERIYLRIYLSWPKEDMPPLEFLCEVRSCTLADEVKRTWQVGVKYLDIADDIRSYIARYVLQQQQKELKQTKLIEDDDGYYG